MPCSCHACVARCVCRPVARPRVDRAGGVPFGRRCRLPVVPRGVAKGYFRVRLRVATRDRPGAGVPVGYREPYTQFGTRAKTAARRDPVSALRREQGGHRPAGSSRYLVVRAALQIRHCSSQGGKYTAGTFPSKNQNYSTKLPSRSRASEAGSSTADSNACLSLSSMIVPTAATA